MSDRSDEDNRELPPSFEREWPEFLDEIRVALPGVQLLFGFLLAAPFSSRFGAVNGTLQNVFFVCFLATAASCIFLIAPSVYHRLHWRRDVRDKEQMLRTCNRLAIIGGVLLAIAMVAAVYVVTAIVATPNARAHLQHHRRRHDCPLVVRAAARPPPTRTALA